ncbi:hypothetical protein EV401DRAFT_2104184 [Pisolithus croceorrhizus]|nr:hypothetical protein EV401DRAFT_2104184 [Pisolithus croceorrhizus]
MTRKLDNERILRVVADFFGYAMFSHAWQGKEPSFRDLNVAKSVWNLPDTLNEKLRNFCKEAHRLGYSWWKPYLGDTGTNHEKFSEVLHELADAIGIPCGSIFTFSPVDLEARERLRLASTRNATVRENIAYCLIGIFESDIRPHYGEGDDALGHLEETVASSGGRRACMELRTGNEKLYRARVSGLGKVEFITADALPLYEPQKFVFAHPWIRHIRGPSGGVAWRGDLEPDTDSDSDSDGDTGLDDVSTTSPLHSVPVPHVDNYTRAPQMIARLGWPFNMQLLLVQQPNGEYKRVAAENEIVISRFGADITSTSIRAQVLEIL